LLFHVLFDSRWDDALLFAANTKDQSQKDANKELIRRQAEWNEEVGDWVRAAEMFVKSGDANKAVRLLGDNQPNGWAQFMSTIASDLPTAPPSSSSSSSSRQQQQPSSSYGGNADDGDSSSSSGGGSSSNNNNNNRPTLMLCARYLSNAGEDDKARLVYEKLDAVKELMALLMARHKWPEAVALADDPKNKGKFHDSMFEPYAQWLALHDRFDEALAAYRRAGRPDESFRMMEQLTYNAVREGRFKDAAFYYLLLSNEVLKPRPKKSNNNSNSSKQQSQTEPSSSTALAANNNTIAHSSSSSATTQQQQQQQGSVANVKRGGRRGGRNEGKEQLANENEFTNKTHATAATAAAVPATSSLQDSSSSSSSQAAAAELWGGPSSSDVARHCEYMRRAKIYFAYQVQSVRTSGEHKCSKCKIMLSKQCRSLYLVPVSFPFSFCLLLETLSEKAIEPSPSSSHTLCYLLRTHFFFLSSLPPQRIEDLFQPFTSSHPEANFQVAQHLINALGASSSSGGGGGGGGDSGGGGGDSGSGGGAGGGIDALVVPHGVSLVRVLHTLAKNAKELGAYKLSRHAYDKLHNLVLPESEREAVELDMLAIQAKPLRDKPDLLPMCFISGQPSPLLNPRNSGDVSFSGCGHPFVRSNGSFEVLPLVEFCPAPGLSDDEAIDLIRTTPPSSGSGGKHHRNWGGGAKSNVMSMDDEDDGGGGEGDGDDMFNRAVNRALSAFEGNLDGGESKSSSSSSSSGGGGVAGDYVPILCDPACLLSLKRDEIYCLRPRLEVALLKTVKGGPVSQPASASADSKAELKQAVQGLGGAENREGEVVYSAKLGRGVQYCRFFRNMLGSDAPVAVSQAAGQFFMEEDLELALLKEGQCPFSRQSVRDVKDYGAL
jgi:uncharacterized membrane protein YgcG